MPKEKANQDIRQLAKDSRVPLWELASHVGISEATMTRLLRCELPESQKELLKAGINELKGK